jgi:hypothetical protein
MREPWKTITIWCVIVGGFVAGAALAGPWGAVFGFIPGVVLAFTWRN